MNTGCMDSPMVTKTRDLLTNGTIRQSSDEELMGIPFLSLIEEAQDQLSSTSKVESWQTSRGAGWLYEPPRLSHGQRRWPTEPARLVRPRNEHREMQEGFLTGGPLPVGCRGPG